MRGQDIIDEFLANGNERITLDLGGGVEEAVTASPEACEDSVAENSFFTETLANKINNFTNLGADIPYGFVDDMAIVEGIGEKIYIIEEKEIYTSFFGYDPWHISDELLRDFKADFGKNAMNPVRQGTLTLSDPMKNLAADFKAKRIVYDNNPILKWCLINTEVKTDINGNIQPVKGLDSRKRIDGVAALLDAYKVLQDKRDQYVNLN